MNSVPSGEIRAVEKIARKIADRGPNRAIVGPGDDTAIIPSTPGQMLITIDTVTEGQDFRWQWPSGITTSLRDIGWKLAAQNLSDINAMGAMPTFMVLSCTLDEWAWREDASKIVDGILDACVELGQSEAELVGGDTGRGTEFSASLTVLGTFRDEERDPLLRSNGKPGDNVYVAGDLGKAAAGLAILESPHSELTGKYAQLVAAQLRPMPSLTSGPAAIAAGATCGMDVSDGLLMDARRIACASKVAIDLSSKALNPFVEQVRAAAADIGVDALDWVLTGGEDYALLVSCAPDVILPDDFQPVGKVLTAEAGMESRITIDGREITERGGWDPFAQNPS